MARVKFFNKKTGKWEYADKAFDDSGGGMPNEAEQLELLIETDMLPAVQDSNGAILTDENGNIIFRY